MRSFRLDPYLWVHLAGFAVVPLWLDLCLLGLSTGNPALPTGVEIGFLSLVGALPILWMQWQKPFCIYSLLFLALRPDRMDENQRRILRLFRDPLVKFLAGLAPLPLIWVVWKLYGLAPLATDLSPFPNRGVGLVVAAIAFLLANLFVQVPLGVVRVLLVPERAFANVPPYPPEQIKKDFTLLGLRVNRILPDWSVSDRQVKAKPSVEPSSSIAVSDIPVRTLPSEDWDDEVIPLKPSAVDDDQYAAPAEEVSAGVKLSSDVDTSPSLSEMVAADSLTSNNTFKLDDAGVSSESSTVDVDECAPPAEEPFAEVKQSSDSTSFIAEVSGSLLPEDFSLEDLSSPDAGETDSEQLAELVHENAPVIEEAVSSQEIKSMPMETSESEIFAESFSEDPISTDLEPIAEPSQADEPEIKEDPSFSSTVEDSDNSEPSLQP